MHPGAMCGVENEITKLEQNLLFLWICNLFKHMDLTWVEFLLDMNTVSMKHT